MVVEMMTSVALMTATHALPFFSLSLLTDDEPMRDLISCPPAIAITTSLMTEPFLIDTTLPGNWFCALIAIISFY